MSLLGNGTLANQGLPYYGGGGGGGGGGGSTVTVTASTLTVSTILGGGPGQSLAFPNGFELPVGANIVSAGGGAPSTGDIDFPNNNGQIVGVSTINGAPYPPGGGGAVSSVTASVHVGTAPTVFTPLGMTVQANRYYLCSANILDIGITSGTLTPGDSITIVAGSDAGTNAIGTIDLVQASTMRGRLGGGGAGSAAFTPTGQVESLSTTMTFTAIPNSTMVCSTFLSMAGWANALPM